MAKDERFVIKLMKAFSFRSIGEAYVFSCVRPYRDVVSWLSLSEMAAAAAFILARMERLAKWPTMYVAGPRLSGVNLSLFT